MGTLPDSESFLGDIVREARRGFSFTPLIGSGLSAASGILMGMDFACYLAYAVYKGVGADNKKDKWDFSTNGWPPYGNADDYKKALKWVRTEYDRICLPNFETLPAYPELVREVRPKMSSADDLRALIDAIDRPPVPMAIRAPEFIDDRYDARRIARTLRAKSGETEQGLTITHIFLRRGSHAA